MLPDPQRKGIRRPEKKVEQSLQKVNNFIERWNNRVSL